MKRRPFWNLILAGGLALFIALVGLPFWWVISGSFKLPQEIIARAPTMIPQSFTLQHYEKLLSSSDYGTYLANSLLVSGLSAIFTLLLAIPAGYAFFRLEFRGRETSFRIIPLA